MVQAVLWAALSGFIARSLLPGAKPGPVTTVVAGFAGCLLGFLVGHEILQIHEFHLFRPESLTPAVMASATVLIAIRRLARLPRRQGLFR